MPRLHLLAVATVLALAACSQAPNNGNSGTPAASGSAPAKASTTAAAEAQVNNPFFTASTLPYQAPPFDKIKDSDYQPAIEEGMKQQLAEVEQIANSAEAPTFENTYVALEKSGILLSR